MVFTPNEIKNGPIKTGIYSIKFNNSINHKVYIGSSGSINYKNGYLGIKTRWIKHLNSLRGGTHYSKKLQHAYNKYGEGCMIFTVIEECDPENCLILEDYYIEKYDSFKNGYNTKPKATSCLGYSPSAETIAKTKKTKRKRRIPYEKDVVENFKKNKNARKTSEMVGITMDMTLSILKDYDIQPKNGLYKIKKIYMYSLDGILIGEWNSAKECCIDMGYKSSCSVSHVASGRHVSYMGKWFSYDKKTKEEALIEINSRILKGKKKMSNPEMLTLKNIHQYDLEGNLIKIWPTSTELKKQLGLKNLSPISAVLSGKKKSYKNFIWKREDDCVKD